MCRFKCKDIFWYFRKYNYHGYNAVHSKRQAPSFPNNKTATAMPIKKKRQQVYSRHAFSPPETKVQNFVKQNRTSQHWLSNERQDLSNSGVGILADFLFHFLLVIIFISAGFILGYYSYANQSTLVSYDSNGTSRNSSSSSMITNTDTKTITTSSNSSVINTNNDADTITNTVTATG